MKPSLLLPTGPSHRTGGQVIQQTENPSRRYELGRSHFANTLNWWMIRCGISHAQLGSIADWAMREDGTLISSQISHLRNANIRNPSLLAFDALGAANQAIWLWRTAGSEVAIKQFGTSGLEPPTAELLDRIDWLPQPEQPDQPLRFAQWCELFCGLLQLPYVDRVVVPPQEARQLSDELGRLLDQLVSETGMGMREGMAEILKLYPVADSNRINRLRGVILGHEHYNHSQVEEELFAISELVAQLRGLPDGQYGPRELYAELTRKRRRT